MDNSGQRLKWIRIRNLVSSLLVFAVLIILYGPGVAESFDVSLPEWVKGLSPFGVLPVIVLWGIIDRLYYFAEHRRPNRRWGRIRARRTLWAFTAFAGSIGLVAIPNTESGWWQLFGVLTVLGLFQSIPSRREIIYLHPEIARLNFESRTEGETARDQ